ncbi:hypothetical protein GOV04_02125 [Candidatus Woesearchaeota archaeon]|nr:hypothetical protein [Candidatus Woesearchaeota archaeon]
MKVKTSMGRWVVEATDGREARDLHNVIANMSMGNSLTYVGHDILTGEVLALRFTFAYGKKLTIKAKPGDDSENHRMVGDLHLAIRAADKKAIYAGNSPGEGPVIHLITGHCTHCNSGVCTPLEIQTRICDRCSVIKCEHEYILGEFEPENCRHCLREKPEDFIDESELYHDALIGLKNIMSMRYHYTDAVARKMVEYIEAQKDAFRPLLYTHLLLHYDISSCSSPARNDHDVVVSERWKFALAHTSMVYMGLCKDLERAGYSYHPEEVGEMVNNAINGAGLKTEKWAMFAHIFLNGQHFFPYVQIPHEAARFLKPDKELNLVFEHGKLSEKYGALIRRILRSPMVENNIPTAIGVFFAFANEEFKSPVEKGMFMTMALKEMAQFKKDHVKVGISHIIKGLFEDDDEEGDGVIVIGEQGLGIPPELIEHLKRRAGLGGL